MLVLLPPSETKTSPDTGAPVDLASLSHPELAATRRRVGDALARTSGTKRALETLDVGLSLAAEVARNTTLWDNPTAPAARVYTGVLYDAARMSEWDHAMLEASRDRVRIVSALWGAVSPADRIPAYRLSMGSLPRLGSLAALWKPRLDDPLTELADGRVVVDGRSASYAAAWSPAGVPWVSVKVMRELDGKRSVVSHMAKHTRGLLAAHLAGLATPPETPDEVADAARGLVGESLVDLSLTSGKGNRYELTLVIAG